MVVLKLFAGFREKIGQSEIEVEVKKNTRLGDILTELEHDYPELDGLLTGMGATIAVNHEVADEDYIVNKSDEIAIFPPVSGG